MIISMLYLLQLDNFSVFDLIWIVVYLVVHKVATLNDEHDWRNGMRVKPLKHLVLYLISLTYPLDCIYNTVLNFRVSMARGSNTGEDMIPTRTAPGE